MLGLIFQLMYDFTVAIICWPLIGVICLLFSSIKIVLDSILKIWIGNQYGGLIKIEDAMLDRRDMAQRVILVLLIFKSDKKMKMVNFINKTLQDKVFNRPYDDYIKLTSTRHVCLGYSYYLKNDYSVEECVKTIPDANEPFTEEEFTKFASKTFNKPFPKNDSAMWEVFVSENHLERIENDTSFRYPVIMKYHHSVADATSLVGFFIDSFSNTNTTNYNDNIFNKSKSSDINLSRIGRIKQFAQRLIEVLQLYFCIIFISPSILYKNVYLPRGGGNTLKKLKVTDDTYVTRPTVANLNYVSKIKKIKNRVPNTKFPEVIATALAASLNQYFKKDSLKAPTYIMAAVIRILKYPKNDKSRPPKLRNKSTSYCCDLDIDKIETLTECLEKVKINEKKVTNFEIVALRFFFSKICGLLPRPMATLLIRNCSPRIVISNVPGCDEIKISDSLCIETISPIAPVTINVGFSLTTFSYGDKFLINALVERDMIPLESDAKQIINDCYHNFDLLDMEIGNKTIV